jgi:hypothetical protein
VTQNQAQAARKWRHARRQGMGNDAGAVTEICAQGTTGIVEWALLLVAVALGIGIWCPGGADSAVVSVRMLDDSMMSRRQGVGAEQ